MANAPARARSPAVVGSGARPCVWRSWRRASAGAVIPPSAQYGHSTARLRPGPVRRRIIAPRAALAKA
ncbi:hypothetical protein GCM10027073_15780 [Streptomyces chlorus]